MVASGGRLYRGDDRRDESEPFGLLDRAHVVAGSLLVLLLLAMVVVSLLGGAEAAVPQAPISLHVAAVGLAGLLGVGTYVHWRATGAAISLRTNAAAWVLVAVGLLDVAVAVGVSGPAVAARPGLVAAAGLWMAAAMRGPEVDTELRPSSQLRDLGLLVAACVIPLVVADAWWTTGGRTVVVSGMLVGVGGWTAAGVLGMRGSGRGSHGLRTWLALTAVVVAAAQLLRLAGLFGTTVGMLDAAVVHAGGLCLAIVGVLVTLARSSAGRRQDLLRTRQEASAATAGDVERVRARTHDIRNALFAIEGATTALENYRDRLSEEQRQGLERGLMAGIATLRALMLGDRAGDASAGAAPARDSGEARGAPPRSRPSSDDSSGGGSGGDRASDGRSRFAVPVGAPVHQRVDEPDDRR